MTRAGLSSAPPQIRGESVFYVVESSKSFYEANLDFAPVVERLGFVILHAADLGEMLQHKEIGLDEDCQIYDVINYRLVEKLLAIDTQLGLILPSRISIFTRDGATLIGIGRPIEVPAEWASDPAVAVTLAEFEERLRLIVDEVR